jgi:hypothetical protein
MTPEGRVKAMIKRQMECLPGSYRFMPVQNGMGAPALDFYYCVNGYFIAIEAKAPGKWYTPRQEATRDAIRVSGGRVYLVDGLLSMERALEDITQHCMQWCPKQTFEP